MCGVATVPSAARSTVNMFPATPMTLINSLSILILNMGNGKREDEDTVTVVDTAVIPPI